MLFDFRYYLDITNSLPFNIGNYLLPFAITIGVCFVIMLVFTVSLVLRLLSFLNFKVSEFLKKIFLFIKNFWTKLGLDVSKHLYHYLTCIVLNNFLFILLIIFRLIRIVLLVFFIQEWLVIHLNFVS